MGTNAPGQILGFSLQFPRALWHLLNCGADDKVCLEVFGDVGVTKDDGSKLTEEDKSSQVGNPVTDLSTDLWKTFYNWTTLVISGELDAENTLFLLYTNKKGRKAIIDTFHIAFDDISAKTGIDAAWKKLIKVDAKHKISTYIEYLKMNESTFIKIVKRFEFQVGSGSGNEEVKKAIRTKHVSDSQVEFIQHSLTGWLHKIVLDRLSKKQDAIITWIEFDTYAKTIFERARKRELIDFTLQYPVDHAEVRKQKLERPPYIRQLEAIKGDDDDIQQAVTDFLKAKVNRLNWIAQELIDEDSAKEFEQKLTDFWQSQRKIVNLTHSTLPDEERGNVVYHLCRGRQQMIKNQDPPSATVAGTYHLMSDSLSIGWHPKWEDSFISPTKNKHE